MASPSSSSPSSSVDDFLRPLRVDDDTRLDLCRRFIDNFSHLAAAASPEQFLPTPISESILRPQRTSSGGTNLRVGFVHLLAVNGSQVNGPNGHSNNHPPPRVRRLLERSWPIANHLKHENADSLFRWIGGCIAEVVDAGCREFDLCRRTPLPLGVSFSFPTEQQSLSEATIKSMGKGFAVPPDIELGARLCRGYEKFRAAADLPPVVVAAIANDSVSTLVSFIFTHGAVPHRRPAMGLILGTGTNATVPLRLACLHPAKRRREVNVLPGESMDDVKIAVNTEWSIRGTEPPLRQLGLITAWDDVVSRQNEAPGFQPLEYMTAGRYLGELARIVLLAYMTEALGLAPELLPPALLEPHCLTTTFLSHLRPTPGLVAELRAAFPEVRPGFEWTDDLAEALYRITKAIELRAAAIMAAAIVALLTMAEELPAEGSRNGQPDVHEVGVGYTGGCIVHFQDYLADCQAMVDDLVTARRGTGDTGPRVVLSPCHDGGIIGAGILVAAALCSSSQKLEARLDAMTRRESRAHEHKTWRAEPLTSYPIICPTVKHRCPTDRTMGDLLSPGVRRRGSGGWRGKASLASIGKWRFDNRMLPMNAVSTYVCECHGMKGRIVQSLMVVCRVRFPLRRTGARGGGGGGSQELKQKETRREGDTEESGETGGEAEIEKEQERNEEEGQGEEGKEQFQTSYLLGEGVKERERDGNKSTHRPSMASPVAVPAAKHGSDDVDPDEFERISRSLPTVSPMLEPEPVPTVGLIIESESEPNTGGPTRRGSTTTQASETTPLLSSPPSRPSPRNEDVVNDDDETAPFLGGTSPTRFWFIFSQVLATQFLCCFDGTIMASSHPVITSYFGTANSASWLSTAFLLTSTAFQPLLGRLSDALGRKPLFLASMVVFTVATAWCALASSMETFIVARALCGLGAGGALTIGSIVTSDLVPIERRGAYQSYMNVVYGIGSALGAALGGAMAEALGWRWEFGVQVPPMLLCLGVSAVVMPSGLGVAEEGVGVWRALRSFDTKGSLLLTACVSFLILGLNLGGNVLAWSHPFVVASLLIFAVCLPIFVYVESRVPKPILPLRLIREAPRANLIYANFIGAILTNAIFFNIPLYFQAVLLSSATSSGLRLVLPSLVASAAGTSVGFAITWSRRLKWPVLWGAVCYLVGCICLFLLERNLPAVFYLAALIPAAIGQGFQFPGTFMAVLACSTPSEQAVVTTTLILWRSIGLVLGVASSSLVVQNALVYYLARYVQGPEASQVIDRVRASVEAVALLRQPYRDQVVRSYEAALRLAFACCVLLAVVSIVLVLPMKLPRLGVRKKR
ncbi:hypothetical protein CP533_3945 [Ophiocordyceps camponoti-saundersi (nom. inval.)]|nr:hypothetical protein CP533_3945 [Ophiocordyceps camponoti-saundersi (nom. inval.)]